MSGPPRLPCFHQPHAPHSISPPAPPHPLKSSDCGERGGGWEGGRGSPVWCFIYLFYFFSSSSLSLSSSCDRHTHHTAHLSLLPLPTPLCCKKKKEGQPRLLFHFKTFKTFVFSFPSKRIPNTRDNLLSCARSDKGGGGRKLGGGGREGKEVEIRVFERKKDVEYKTYNGKHTVENEYVGGVGGGEGRTGRRGVRMREQWLVGGRNRCGLARFLRYCRTGCRLAKTCAGERGGGVCVFFSLYFFAFSPFCCCNLFFFLCSGVVVFFFAFLFSRLKVVFKKQIRTEKKFSLSLHCVFFRPFIVGFLLLLSFFFPSFIFLFAVCLFRSSDRGGRNSGSCRKCK